MKRIAGLAIAMLLLTAAPALAQEPQPDTPVQIEFEGGTVAQYVELIQRKFRVGANIVVEPDAKVVAIGPVELSTYDAQSAASAVEHLEVDTDQAMLYVRKGPTYVVIGVQKPEPVDLRRETHVWTLAAIVDGGTSLDDALSAIRFALEMTTRGPDDGDGRVVRVHEDTQLLMINGTRAELEAVEQVVSNLNDVAHWRENRDREQTEAQALLEARANIRNLEDERDAMRAEIQQLQLHVMHLQNERQE